MTKQVLQQALECIRASTEYRVGNPAFEQAECAIADALAQQGEQDLQIDQLIQERDHRDEIINKLCDAVLGPDRYEWSSMYFFEDAVREVEERMYALAPQGEPVAWKHTCNALCVDGLELWIDSCPHCGKPRSAGAAPAAQPVAGLNRDYAKQLIEALHENGDPVSVDAAEEFERLLAAPAAQPDTRKVIEQMVEALNYLISTSSPMTGQQMECWLLLKQSHIAGQQWLGENKC